MICSLFVVVIIQIIWVSLCLQVAHEIRMVARLYYDFGSTREPVLKEWMEAKKIVTLFVSNTLKSSQSLKRAVQSEDSQKFGLHPGTVLGLFWDYSGTILRLFWDSSGTHLGTLLGLLCDSSGGLFWDSYGTPMWLLWDSCGTPMGPFWDSCGTPLGLLWSLLCQLTNQQSINLENKDHHHASNCWLLHF
jgi:hypothetical protein